MHPSSTVITFEYLLKISCRSFHRSVWQTAYQNAQRECSASPVLTNFHRMKLPMWPMVRIATSSPLRSLRPCLFQFPQTVFSIPALPLPSRVTNWECLPLSRLRCSETSGFSALAHSLVPTQPCSGMQRKYAYVISSVMMSDHRHQQICRSNRSLERSWIHTSWNPAWSLSSFAWMNCKYYRNGIRPCVWQAQLKRNSMLLGDAHVNCAIWHFFHHDGSDEPEGMV